MNLRQLVSVSLVVAAIGQIGCRKASRVEDASSSLQVTSGSFPAGGAIPSKFTCDGANVSPALSWSSPPPKTQAFALIVDDPDAGFTFTHWVIYNLPANTQELPEGIGQQEHPLPGGTLQGQNGFDKTAYGGPCPPGTSSHHYVFRVYALDSRLDLPPGVTEKQLKRAIEGHVLAQGQLIALYHHPS
jgi:Raf kinase inhibitor-like YbhB/YbcL family protein